MMPLVQWLLIGLAIAIVSLPLVRWFWKRWDKPTPEMIAHKEEQLEKAAEARVWAAMEAKIEAEVAKKHEWAEIQMAKAVALVKAKPLDEVSASKAWDALGVDEPIIISTKSEIDVSDLLEEKEITIESEEKVTVPEMLDLPVISPEDEVSISDVDSEVEPSNETDDDIHDETDDDIDDDTDDDTDVEKDVIEHFAVPVRQRKPDEEDDWQEVVW